MISLNKYLPQIFFFCIYSLGIFLILKLARLSINNLASVSHCNRPRSLKSILSGYISTLSTTKAQIKSLFIVFLLTVFFGFLVKNVY